jgi:hypothetical protein
LDTRTIDRVEREALAAAHETWRDHLITTHGAQAWAVAQPGGSAPARHFLRVYFARELGLGSRVPASALDRIGAAVLGWVLRRRDGGDFRKAMETLDDDLIDAFTVCLAPSLPCQERPLSVVGSLLGTRRSAVDTLRLGGLAMVGVASGSPQCSWDFLSTASTQHLSLMLACRQRLGSVRPDPALCAEAAAWVAWGCAEDAARGESDGSSNRTSR